MTETDPRQRWLDVHPLPDRQGRVQQMDYLDGYIPPVGMDGCRHLPMSWFRRHRNLAPGEGEAMT